jgi:hypothetical protein
MLDISVVALASDSSPSHAAWRPEQLLAPVMELRGRHTAHTGQPPVFELRQPGNLDRVRRALLIKAHPHHKISS